MASPTAIDWTHTVPTFCRAHFAAKLTTLAEIHCHSRCLFGLKIGSTSFHRLTIGSLGNAFSTALAVSFGSVLYAVRRISWSTRFVYARRALLHTSGGGGF